MDWVQVFTIIVVIAGIVIAFNNQTNKRIDDLRLSVNDKIASLEKLIIEKLSRLDPPDKKTSSG